jgi:hypothetical protein
MNRMTKWIALAALVSMLGACATGPATSSAPKKQAHWNDGVWNSTLGYHGPANAMSMAFGPAGS